MIPRARLLSDAFWWGRRLERFYLSYRMLLANERLDLQSLPNQRSASGYGWGLLCTGQWEPFHEHFSFLDRFHQWYWWTDRQAPFGLPALYTQLRQGLRAMRGELRAEWFEQWSLYQGYFEETVQSEQSLDHPMLQAVSQLYPMALGRLEIDQGRTPLLGWIRMGIEWERLDMTLRLLILYISQPIDTSHELMEMWINDVQDVPKLRELHMNEWFAGRCHLRTLPAIYARLGQCLRDDPVLSHLALPLMPVKMDKSLLLDCQLRLAEACSKLEELVSARVEGL